MIRSSVILLILTLAAAMPADAQQWLELRTANYSVLYQAGYERDAEFARTWMDRAEELMRSKYGVSADGYFISLYLHPAPTNGAGVGQATLNCCPSALTNGKRTGTIQYLSPSAQAWKDTRSTTSLGLPFDDNYHAKVLMSEYIPIGHLALQATRPTSSAWGYYGSTTPSWFVQGLEEFDAIYRTTDANRTLTSAKLREWARNNRTKFICCSTLAEQSTIGISDVYNGGAFFMTFLAAEYGEDIHARLLRNTAATFDEALAQETRPDSTVQMFERFREWVSRGAVLPARR